MPPKGRKAATEGEGSKEAAKKAAKEREEALAALRLERACFDSNLLIAELTERFNYIVLAAVMRMAPPSCCRRRCPPELTK